MSTTTIKESGYLVFNPQPSLAVTNEAAQRFVNSIGDELSMGFGFVPFIGAGLSAPSGAPLVQEIRSYLQRCIGLALGVEQVGMRPWNPRTDQWPPFTDRNRIRESDWMNKVQSRLTDLRENDPSSSDIPVFQEAYGAMAEWRTSLQFLSRVVRDRQGIGHDAVEVLALDASDPQLIDSCLLEIFRGKHPALGHRMLAALGGLLRLDVLLTTNFDNLLEGAFEDARNVLTVFETHLNSTLPHWSTLATQRSLVKMHGSRQSLRADYSLSSLPLEADRHRFLEYLLTANSRNRLRHDLANNINSGPLPPENHLIVMGCSAEERRTRSYIEHAWTHLDDTFKVFWLCHTIRDVRTVTRFSKDFVAKHDDHSPIGQNRFRNSWCGSYILRHTSQGLFLLQLFQMLRHCLPASGSIFPSVSRLCVPPLQSNETASGDGPLCRNAVKYMAELKTRLRSVQLPGHSLNHHKLVVATSGEHNGEPPRGVTTVCAMLFEELESTSICLWLDLNDIAGTADLFEKLLDAAYYRLGVETWMPVYVAAHARSCAAEIRRLVTSTNKPWVIFLNARETPGANRRHFPGIQHDRPNDWLDQEKASSKDSQDCTKDFLELLTELSGPESESISVVLICRQCKNGDSPLVKALKEGKLIDEVDMPVVACTNFNEKEVLEKTLGWAKRHAQRRRFLFTLVLMQRTRYLSTIWNSAINAAAIDKVPDDLKKGPYTDTALNWIHDLEKIGLIRHKPGGFIWMHARVRWMLREHFDRTIRKSRRRPALLLIKAQIHADLADWYERVLASCESPAAVFEAIDHACQAAEAFLEAGSILDAKERLGWATTHLRKHFFLIQTHGYSRGSCRRLEYIRAELCKDILNAARTKSAARINEIGERVLALRVQCTEVMRAIAREVSEDRVSYQRHHEICSLLIHRDTKGAESISQRGFHLYQKLIRRKEPGGAGEFLRWWRWNAMLAINSRSCHLAIRSIAKAVDAMSVNRTFKLTKGGTSYPLQRTTGQTDVKLLGKVMAIAGWAKNDDISVLGRVVHGPEQQYVRVETLRLIEQHVAARLLHRSCDRRIGHGEPHHDDEPFDPASLLGLCDLGHSLASQVMARDSSPESPHAGPAMQCKARLYMHQSICVRSQPGNSSSSSRDAMKLLLDAESCLNSVEGTRHSEDKALVELHRAEMRLWDAEEIRTRTVADKIGRTFRDLWTYRSDRSSDVMWRNEGQAIRLLLLGANNNKVDLAGFRTAKSLIEDAMRFLARAELVLFKRRQNVWWTTWLFERWLRAIAMAVWATVPEKGTPIPFLGLEAAARKTATKADLLLEDAQRMIRIDPYRLATIVDAYGSCAYALRIRTILDGASDETNSLPERQKDMHRRFSNALNRLNEIYIARKELNDQVNVDKSTTDLSPVAYTYVDQVLVRAKQLDQSLKIVLF